VADPLQGISRDHHQELGAILQRLAGLWAELTKAATERDRGRAEAIKREIAECRRRVEEIKQAGTVGKA
jgi:uncharacterized coiled-coil DUF342 family protein